MASTTPTLACIAPRVRPGTYSLSGSSFVGFLQPRSTQLEAAERYGHLDNIAVSTIGEVAAAQLSNPSEPVAHGVGVDEKLPCGGFDGAPRSHERVTGGEQHRVAFQHPV